MPRHLRSVLASAELTAWRRAAEQGLATLPAEHPDRQPTSGSLRLRALSTAPCRGFETLMQLASALRPAAVVPQGWALLTSDCWLRVQHPPALRPPGQHPHGWHQDGALGVDFHERSAALAPLRPRPMRTLWLPLTDCGVDAPSLEWIVAAQPRLLWPAELDDALLRVRHGAAARERAVLAAGDALLFDGALLHRTHVLPTMTRSRMSLELRWVPPATAVAGEGADAGIIGR